MIEHNCLNMGCASLKTKPDETKPDPILTPTLRKPTRSQLSIYRSETVSSQESINNVYSFESEVIGWSFLYIYFSSDVFIGLGQSGQVRVASLLSNPKKKFAVKSISKDRTTKDFLLLKSEIEILRELDHPNIVKFYETYQDERSFHIVMEYCSGGELLDRMIDKGGLSEQECSVIMEKAFSAVRYLHERGIVHRDIKPENFLFANSDDDAEIKLIDFGLSRRIDSLETKLHTKSGTPLYVAPEVLKGEYDYRSDYWSLGVTMYIILCGNFPFEEQETSDLFAKIMAGKYTFAGEEWRSISKKAKDLISKLLTVDPKKRYTAQQALEHPWIKDYVDQPSEASATLGIIHNLKQFRGLNKFKKETLNVLVTLLTEKEIKKLRDAFRYCDKDHCGEISINNLKQILKEENFAVTNIEINKILKDLDVNDEDTIRYSEFLAAAMNSKLYLSKEKLWTAFKFFDIENSNYITQENIQEVMKRAGKLYSDEQIREMIQEVDIGKDGKISFDEFCRMMGFTTLQKEMDTERREKQFSLHGALVLKRSTPIQSTESIKV